MTTDRSAPGVHRLAPRLMFTAAVAVLVFMYSFWQWQPIFEWLVRPAKHALVQRVEFLMTGPTDVFQVQLSVAVNVTVLVVVALLSYQLVVAAAPTRLLSARVVGVACAGLFCAGVIFGWFVIVPPVLRATLTDSFAVGMRAPEYLQLVTFTVLSTAIACQLPAVYALAEMRVRAARWLLYSWACGSAAVAVTALRADTDRMMMLLEVAVVLLLCATAVTLVRIAERRKV